MEHEYKLLVKDQTHQIIWKISKAELKNTPNLSSDSLQKIAGKLRKWQSLKEINNFTIEHDLLARIETSTQSNAFNFLPDNYIFQFNVGYGWSSLEGVSLFKPLHENSAACLSIDAPACDIAKWELATFHQNIAALCQELNQGTILEAESHRVLSKAKLGLKLEHEPLLSHLEVPKFSDGFGIVLGSDDSWYISITDPLTLTNPLNSKDFHRYLSDKVKDLKKFFVTELNREYILSQFNFAKHSFEALGLKMPLTIFGSHCRPKKGIDGNKSTILETTPKICMPPLKIVKTLVSQPTDSKVGTKSEIERNSERTPQLKVKAHADLGSPNGHELQGEKQAKVPEDYVGLGLLKIKPSLDKMSAVITGFKKPWALEFQGKLTHDWLENEMTRLKLVPRQEHLIKRVLNLLKLQRDPNEITLVEGVMGKPASEPVLVDLSQEQKSLELDPTTQTFNLFEARRSTIRSVKAGALLAAWAYKSPEVPGIDIFGAKVKPQAPIPPIVQVGPGARFDGIQQFFAQCDGLASVNTKELKIDVLKHYVQKGSVNLSSGNIIFDGSVTVEGEIESGSTIQCTNDLLIKKGVASATLIVGGNIIAEEGVVNSKISCLGDVSASFIENTELTVKGQIQASKAILNCKIIANKVLSLGEPGLIAGGEIYCFDRIVCQNMGFIGSNTYANLGVDWQRAKKKSIIEKRLNRIKEFIDTKNLELNLLESKPAKQLTTHHKEGIRITKKKLKKANSLLEKIKILLSKFLEHAEQFNENAELIVTGLLSDNVHLKIGLTLIERDSASREVLVSSKIHNESYIRHLPEKYLIDKDGYLIDKSRPKKISS